MNKMAAVEGSRCNLIDASSCDVFKVLANMTRVRIYNALAEKKCLTFFDIMKEVGVKSPKHLRYHLETIKKKGLIGEKKVQTTRTSGTRCRRYFFLKKKVILKTLTVEEPVLEIPLDLRNLTKLLAKFKRQKAHGMIPVEIANEIGARLDVAKKLRDFEGKISKVDLRL